MNPHGHRPGRRVRLVYCKATILRPESLFLCHVKEDSAAFSRNKFDPPVFLRAHSFFVGP
jgi:hypothetical protein